MPLAQRKASAGAALVPDGWVLAADTLVFLNARALGKPADKADAGRMLRALSGNTHRVLTGMCLKNAATGDDAWGKSLLYLCFDQDRLIGLLSIRYELPEALTQSIGDIGYGVRPNERNKGYATQMLKMMLEEAKQKKIYKVLVGAYEGNVGSCKTIEKCGGQFENCVYMEKEEEAIRRYWFDLL